MIMPLNALVLDSLWDMFEDDSFAIALPYETSDFENRHTRFLHPNIM